jgi:RNA polymerase primary sigma factor
MSTKAARRCTSTKALARPAGRESLASAAKSRAPQRAAVGRPSPAVSGRGSTARAGARHAAVPRGRAAGANLAATNVVESAIDKDEHVTGTRTTMAKATQTKKATTKAPLVSPAPQLGDQAPLDAALAADAPVLEAAPVTSRLRAGDTVDVEADEEEAPPVSAAEAPAPESKTLDRDIEEGGGDSMLARYFREMSNHSVMDQEEELRTAQRVEKTEVEY